MENGTAKEPGIMGSGGLADAEARNKRGLKRTRDDVAGPKQFDGELRRSKRLKAGRA